jgi:hypothetical protein
MFVEVHFGYRSNRLAQGRKVATDNPVRCVISAYVIHFYPVLWSEDSLPAFKNRFEPLSP